MQRSNKLELGVETINDKDNYFEVLSSKIHNILV